MKYLVTGATGKLGSKVVESLLTVVPVNEVAVSVRNIEKAEKLRSRGVDVRHGDFDAPETLDAAFEGVDRLLIISADGDNDTRIQQHKNAVDAAKRAGVQFIAYTSLADATNSKNTMAPPHVATEAAIKETGIPYAFLRNNWYLENEIGNIQGAIAGAPWTTAAGDGKVGWALQADYAAAAAAVLIGKGHENKTYELSGPLLTQEELATLLGEVLGHEVAVNHVDSETYAATMKEAGIPDFVLPILVGIEESIRNGSLAVESNDFEHVLGRPIIGTQDALRILVRDLM